MLGVALLACVGCTSAYVSRDVVYFGTAKASFHITPKTEYQLFNYTCKNLLGGLVTLWWLHGGWTTFNQTRVKAYVDGETTPSFNIQVYTAVAMGFNDESHVPWGNTRLGSSGHQGAYNAIRIPFYRNFSMTLTMDSRETKNQTGWFYIRGLEATALQLGDSLFIPPSTGARLRVYTSENVTLQPLDYIDVVPKLMGRGALYAVTVMIQSENFDVLEGCFRAYFNSSNENVTLLSSGTEEYFFSSSYFGAASNGFALPMSGLLHYHANTTLSAYRVHQVDPIIFNSGFRLRWRNGEKADPASGQKCTAIDSGNVIGHPGVSHVTFYAYVYQWP